MDFFSMFSLIANAASAILPAVAQARAVSDPSVSNAGLINTAKAIQVVAPVVQHVEAVAAAQPSAPMTGMQKLQLAQAVLQDVHDTAVANGTLPPTSQFAEYWNIAVPAITAVCAAAKAQQAQQESQASVING